MIIPFVFSFLLPVILSLVLTPGVIKFAHYIGATDAPGERKVHTTLMPRIGGMAIFFSALISIISVWALFPEMLIDSTSGNQKIVVLALCFTSLFIMGFWDDLKPLSPTVKFGVQLILAGIIYFAGFKISNITNPMDMGVLELGIIDFPLTIIWIVGVTNAFNLIDGLDGLTSGVATIACVSIFIVSAMSGYIGAALLSLIIAGALVGFLRYNFNPAKIFLGDSGSLIIGFALALLAIESTAKTTTGFALLFPILVLLLPITDTLISMIRRLVGSFLKTDSDSKTQTLLHRLYGMFTPDKLHIHHRLLSMGLSHRNTVLVLYAVSIFFAFGALIFTQVMTVQQSWTITVIFGMLLFAGIKKLRYNEMAILDNGLIMPFYKKWIVNKSSFISLMDIAFIAASYSLSYALIKSTNAGSVEFLSNEIMFAAIIFLQLGAFWLTGLYREKMNHFGIGNSLHITTSVAYSVGVTGILISIMNAVPFMVGLQFIILDFYFLMTLVLGCRVAYQALNFWFNRGKRSGEHVLIYGTGDNGVVALHKLTNSPNNSVKVVGFLDDDRSLEGKFMYGYPILGGYWKLAKTHSAYKIDSILICDEQIKSENLKRLRETAKIHKINIKRLNVSLEKVDKDTSEIHNPLELLPRKSSSKKINFTYPEL